MDSKDNKSTLQKLRNFVVVLGLTLFFIYGFLPFVTSSFDILKKMSVSLDKNGIDPSRYYYTDVEQVKEAEQYLDTALNKK